MTTLMQWMIWFPSFALGALLSGWFVGPIMKRRGYNLGREEQRVLDGPAMWREQPLAIESGLPVQLGTLAEHRRRLPIQYGEVTDDTLVVHTVDVLEQPTPARQARLITNLAYRKAQALIALDRVVAPLRTSQGRHRAENIGRSLHGTIAQRRHSRAAEQREVHAAAIVPKVPALRRVEELVSS